MLDMDVLPVPFDCLPLSKQPLPVNYLDMIWGSGQDLMRAARIVLRDRRLYPVMITNFGCGPDSFNLKYLNEIFRSNSLLTLEVDEHTSGVGAVTRIEAFLNNIRNDGHVTDFDEVSASFKPFIPSGSVKKLDRTFYIPIAFHSYRAISAACESIGIRTRHLPPHDKESERLGRMYTAGTECVAYIMDVGDAVKMTRDPDFDPDRAALVLVTSNLGCRISLFPTNIRLVLRDIGYPDVPIIAPRVSMDKDEVRKVLGVKFVRNLFRGMFAIELLARRLTEVRPYEQHAGDTDKAFAAALDDVCGGVIKGGYWDALARAVKRFDSVACDRSEQRPLIGLIGDDYTRANTFANNDFVREIEALGGEVCNASIWGTFLEFQRGMKPRKMFKRGLYGEMMIDLVKSVIGRADGARIARAFHGKLKCYPDPDYAGMLDLASRYLDEKTEPLVIMALAHVMHMLRHGVDGIANLVGFHCAIYAIVSACVKPVYAEHGNIPSLTLFCDFQERVHQKNRIEAFMHQVRQHKEQRRLAGTAPLVNAGV
jgi:predicted nucleotide-binding protein (sugar kinase/HSP70/actin superfamily)